MCIERRERSKGRRKRAREEEEREEESYHSLIGVDTLERFLSKELFDGLSDFGHASHTTNENDFIDVALLNTLRI